MGRTIGVVMSSNIVAGLVEDHKLVSPLHSFPHNPDDHTALLDHPVESLCQRSASRYQRLNAKRKSTPSGLPCLESSAAEWSRIRPTWPSSRAPGLGKCSRPL